MPFHLCSLADRRYLAVDDASGKAVMQRERPTSLWEIYDATGGRQSTQQSDCSESPLDSIAFPFADGKLLKECGLDTGYCGLQLFEGPLANALAAKTHAHNGARAFTALDALLKSAAPLGEELELAPPWATLLGVFQTLYGSTNDFRQDLAEAEDAILEPVRLIAGAPWCAMGSVWQTCHVPVLGHRPYEEEFRVALCEDQGVAMLAVQMACNLKIGFPVGDFLTEALHIFSQPAGGGGPVRLRSLGLAQAGRQQQRALEGMREARKKYVEKALAALRRAAAELLRLEAERIRFDGLTMREGVVERKPPGEEVFEEPRQPPTLEHFVCRLTLGWRPARGRLQDPSCLSGLSSLGSFRHWVPVFSKPHGSTF